MVGESSKPGSRLKTYGSICKIEPAN